MSGKKQCCNGSEQTASDASEAFADDTANGGKANHRSRGHRPIGFIQIQIIGNRQRQTHGNGIA
ncbi:hypothetical protein EIMP300_50670 [Escherichia coli]|uniref:Uncharacterized protein n=1 Tax=Escherichia coli TaxID=562 RepID=A0A8S0FTK0_ECOLX|nr:hypothetical protein EIMP300_50670 [Escherichia coli]